MARLSEICLDISDPQRSLDFYVGQLGMKLLGEESPTSKNRIFALSFPTGAALKLRHRSDLPNAAYHPRESDVFWKLGITIADVEIARTRLIAQNIQVTEAKQFHDIGYLCHFDDPDGYCIELLQHRFARNHTSNPPGEDHVLGNQPNLGQVSLDVANIGQSLAFYRERLPLRLLARQRVPGRDFTLWFLGPPEVSPPSEDPDSLGNREWLWMLPHTTLELREPSESVGPRCAHPPDDELGFRGIGLSDCDMPEARLLDPDEVQIRIG